MVAERVRPVLAQPEAQEAVSVQDGDAEVMSDQLEVLGVLVALARPQQCPSRPVPGQAGAEESAQV